MILSYLLARQGVDVTLLEAHQDLDREFRGDTIHPSTLELMDRLGLADRLHQLPHKRLHGITVATPHDRTTMVDFRRLRSKYPYIMIMSQGVFLQFLADEAGKFESFRLIRGANVNELVERDGLVTGVRYQGPDSQVHQVDAELTVAADGRFSRIRKLAGFEPEKFAPPMDVLWFRLPRCATDDGEKDSGVLHIGGGHFAVLFDRPNDEWQVGFAILKGSFAEVKHQGIEALRQAIAELIPAFADRVNQISDFKQFTVLSVEVSRIPRWHRPGLLLIGDAAHVMSPVGGIGIQYAVQDAVETARQLGPALRTGNVSDGMLADVQKVREKAVRKAQMFQRFMQEQIVVQALQKNKPFRLPLVLRVILRIPGLRNIPAHIIGRGFHPARLPD
jgi:2-polyprenyl-6-methoxyphenol hydroxylase-like FAD-dependent oxidoreductase